MSRLVYSMLCSLDGYVNDPDGGFDWAAPDAEVHRYVNDAERGVGTYLYGRRMYEIMTYWETAGQQSQQPEQPRQLESQQSEEPEDPALQAAEEEYAEIWRAADKIVYSSTLDAATTSRTRLERTFDPDAVRRLKAESATDLSIGGPELAGAALRAGLVDELRIFLAPVVVGGGQHQLPTGLRLDLELLGERRFAGGVVLVHYRVHAR